MKNRLADCEGAIIRKRGRPVQMEADEREALVLNCAIELFQERGPDEVTMNDIAKRAGMSKRTLYTLFSSREELIGAGLKRIGSTLFRPLRPDERSRSLEERLRLLLTFSPSFEGSIVPIEMLRIVIAEARKYPEMSRSLSLRGPTHVVHLLSDELSDAAEAGEIELDQGDIPEAAELLLDMVVGNTIPCLLDPDRILHTPEDRNVRRDRAIRIFLNGVLRRKDS